VPRSAGAALEDSTGASHVAEGGVRVEMMKIESDPNFRSCRCRAGSVEPFNRRFPRTVPL